jgi:hypothetical protein
VGALFEWRLNAAKFGGVNKPGPAVVELAAMPPIAAHDHARSDLHGNIATPNPNNALLPRLNLAVVQCPTFIEVAAWRYCQGMARQSTSGKAARRHTDTSGPAASFIPS